MKIVWYEDLSTNFEKEIESLSEFTGYKMTEDSIKVNNFKIMYDLLECPNYYNIIELIGLERAYEH